MTSPFFMTYRKPHTLVAWLCACVLALCALPMLSACSEQKPTPDPTPSTTSSSPSSPNIQSAWTAGANATDWGTYTLASDTFGNFSVQLPSQPTEEIDDNGALRLIVEGETLTNARYMLLAEPLDDSEFRALTPMNEQEREGQVQWYAADFVGAETFVENMQSAPYEGNVGVRYQATNFNADIWTVLVIDDGQGWVYSLCAYSHGDEPTPSEAEAAQRFLDSFSLIMT
ncbi:MAG: hypothetical protein IKS49_03030 [Actinomycetaceae bacterium]|nr:hypothetical protein [Actinomycetaceae bacterium]